jgi:predicted SnoaL-like aldol condensation-catalyzing enzyme
MDGRGSRRRGHGAGVLKTPREVVEAYNFELWNKRRYELADELIADTVIRHEIGTVETVTREQSLQRVNDAWGRVEHLEFTLLRVIAEGELVAIVYQCRSRTCDGKEIPLGSIEIFRVVDGRICEVWNAARTYAEWQ